MKDDDAEEEDDIWDTDQLFQQQAKNQVNRKPHPLSKMDEMIERMKREIEEERKVNFPGGFLPGDKVRLKHLTGIEHVLNGELGYVHNYMVENKTKYVVAVRNGQQKIHAREHQLQLKQRPSIHHYFDEKGSKEVGSFIEKQWEKVLDQVQNPTPQVIEDMKTAMEFGRRPWYNRTYDRERKRRPKARLWTREEIQMMIRNKCTYIPPVKVEKFEFVKEEDKEANARMYIDMDLKDPLIRDKVQIFDLEPVTRAIRARNKKLNVSKEEIERFDVLDYLNKTLTVGRRRGDFLHNYKEITKSFGKLQ